MNLPLPLPWKHAEWTGIDGLILPLLVGVMRMCWIFPWVLLVQSFLSPTTRGPLLSPWMLVLLPLLSFTFARWSMPTFTRRREPGLATRVRATIASTGLLTILLLTWLRFFQPDFPLWDLRWIVAAGYDIIYWDAVPVEIPGIVLFLLIAISLWLRGALDAQSQFGHEEIWYAFLWGGAALVLLAWVLSEASGRLTNFAGLILLFAGSGLAGLAVANLKTSSGWRRSRRAGGLRITSNRSWLIGIGLTIGALLGIALLVGFLIQPEDAAFLWRWLGAALRAVGFVLFWVAAIVGYVFFVIAEYIARILRQLMGEPRQEEDRQLAPEQEQLEPQLEQPERVFEAVPEPYRWIALIVVAVLVLLIFMLVLRQLRQRQVEEQEELRESVFTGDLLQAQLSDLWNRWRARFGPKPEEPDPFLSLAGEPDTRRLIRQIYQQLLARTKQQAIPRRQAETPRGYGQRLGTHLTSHLPLEPDPIQPDPIQTITAGYVQARYGDEPPSAQTAQAVAQAWQQIEAALAAQTGDSAGDPQEEK